MPYLAELGRVTRANEHGRCRMDERERELIAAMAKAESQRVEAEGQLDEAYCRWAEAYRQSAEAYCPSAEAYCRWGEAEGQLDEANRRWVEAYDALKAYRAAKREGGK